MCIFEFIGESFRVVLSFVLLIVLLIPMFVTMYIFRMKDGDFNRADKIMYGCRDIIFIVGGVPKEMWPPRR